MFLSHSLTRGLRNPLPGPTLTTQNRQPSRQAFRPRVCCSTWYLDEWWVDWLHCEDMQCLLLRLMLARSFDPMSSPLQFYLNLETKHDHQCFHETIISKHGHQCFHETTISKHGHQCLHETRNLRTWSPMLPWNQKSQNMVTNASMKPQISKCGHQCLHETTIY